MSVSFDVDPIDIEELDLHDDEDIFINVYGPSNSEEVPYIGEIHISSEEGKIVISTGNPTNIIVKGNNNL